MDYVVYTFGGGEILWKVFNSLALLFKSNSPYMTSVLKLSLALGGVWLALRAILSANVAVFTRDYIVPTYLILNILLLPKTSIHIIDEVNPDFHYSKVDHVPIGIAAVASTASGISKLLTDVIEGSLKTAEATHYGKTGTLFAARLVSMARDMRIIDPVERQNLKDFVRQCFTLPMVWSNMLAGKKAALETPDLLQLIADNPHSWLGSYWRTKGGDATFRYCKEGAAKAKEVLSVEVPASLADLATGLFGSTQVNTVAASKRLKLYFEDAWQSVSHQTANAHQVAAQEMMMNIYRESSDDKRQEFGLERLHPHLISASSARAKSQQNTGFLVSAQMVGSMLPSLQSTMLAILCVMFVVIVPMTFLPGGFQALVMWLKMILWVESWPIFYAIINCVGMMMASNRGAAYMDTGAGLSLLTQNGLADAAYDAYCYTEGFMAIIPIIAWAVISKSSSALANLSATITRGVDGLSSKMGSEITDGNLNFDNQSFHNRSIAGYQLAQQQLGSSFGFGDKYDDGRINVTYDTRGNPIIQETQTQLKTNVSGTDSLAASLSENAQAATTAGYNFSKASSEQFNQGLQKLYSYGDQYTKGHGVNSRFGSSQDISEGKEWKETMDMAHKFGQQNNISDDKAFEILAHAGVDSGIAGKILGIKGGVSTKGTTSAQDKILIDKAKSSGLSEQFGKHLTSAYKQSTGTDGSLSDQSQKNVLDSIQGNFQQAKHYQEQAQANFSQADTYTKASSIAKSSTMSATTNWNDRILKGVAAERGETVQQTANWASENEDAYRQHASEFMAGKQEKLIQALKTDHPMSEDAVLQKFNDVYNGQVQNTVGDSDIKTARDIATKNEMGEKGKHKMEEDFNALRKESDSHMKQTQAILDGHKGHIENEYQGLEKSYDDRKSKGIFMPIVEKTPAVGSIGNEISKPDDFGSPTSSYHTMKNPSVSGHSQGSNHESPSLSSSVPIKAEEKLTSSHAASSGSQHERRVEFNPSIPLTSQTEGQSREGSFASTESRDFAPSSPPSHRTSGDFTQSSAVTTPSFEGGEKMSASSFEKTGGKSATQTDFVSPSSVRETSSGSRKGEESAPSSFGGTEPRSVQSSGYHYETPAVRETSSGAQNDMQPSTYVRSMEDSIDQGRTANKMASQGRQIKQLKDSIEMSKATIEEEAPLDMTPSQKVES